MKKSTDLKSLIMAPLSGFRHIETTVPEWGGKKFILREPSAEAWARFNDILSQLREEPPPADEPKGKDQKQSLPVEERDRLSRLADALMLVDVLLDEKGAPVFNREDDSDAHELAPHIGPVHSRLIRRAVDLALRFDDAQKK